MQYIAVVYSVILKKRIIFYSEKKGKAYFFFFLLALLVPSFYRMSTDSLALETTACEKRKEISEKDETSKNILLLVPFSDFFFRGICQL